MLVAISKLNHRLVGAELTPIMRHRIERLMFVDKLEIDLWNHQFGQVQ